MKAKMDANKFFLFRTFSVAAFTRKCNKYNNNDIDNYDNDK